MEYQEGDIVLFTGGILVTVIRSPDENGNLLIEYYDGTPSCAHVSELGGLVSRASRPAVFDTREVW